VCGGLLRQSDGRTQLRLGALKSAARFVVLSFNREGLVLSILIVFFFWRLCPHPSATHPRPTHLLELRIPKSSPVTLPSSAGCIGAGVSSPTLPVREMPAVLLPRVPAGAPALGRPPSGGWQGLGSPEKLAFGLGAPEPKNVWAVNWRERNGRSRTLYKWAALLDPWPCRRAWAGGWTCQRPAIPYFAMGFAMPPLDVALQKLAVRASHQEVQDVYDLLDCGEV
jgi:hypothetical protein